MFRAQVEHRCQLHRIYSNKDLCEIAEKENISPEQYSVRWINQWLKAQSETENPLSFSFENHPEDDTQFQTESYTISWRFVTNGGQDDEIIRPVIGVSGLPFYPGSSMKGAFCQACTPEQKQRYHLTKNSDEPSLLRFHGGYPTNDWKKQLVDIVHPQQKWQMRVTNTKEKPKDESAFALISLYQPTIQFGISSLLPDTDWDEIWSIWEKALGYGIGCRVSSGYGLTNDTTGDVIHQVKLHGVGGASKLLNKKTEFRPNIFRAALRGHALRIFSGLNSALAEDIVDELFGGIRSGREKVGLLVMAFHTDNQQWSSDYTDEAYDVTGNLIWQLSGKINNPEHRSYLQNLVKKLTQFAMLLGGFGKSWRRADHRKFYPTYKKHLIGCHWSWVDDDNLIRNSDNPDDIINDAKKVIEETIKSASEWMQKRGFEVKKTIPNQPLTPTPTTTPKPTSTSTQNQNNSQIPQLNRPTRRPVPSGNQTAQQSLWRETWLHNNVQVWGRIARNAEDTKIIPLLHSSKPSRSQNQNINLALQKPTNQNNQSSAPYIYRTCLTGCINPTQIGRLWHRMYPLKDGKFLEIVTIFPSGCSEAEAFINWLDSQKKQWKRVW